MTAKNAQRHQCIDFSRNRLIKVFENDASATFENVSKALFTIVKVDNCFVTRGRRADYIVRLDGKCCVIIELKGVNVDDACIQLFETRSNPDCQQFFDVNTSFLIVCRRYPRFDTKVIKAKERAMKKFKSRLVVNSGRFEGRIESLSC